MTKLCARGKAAAKRKFKVYPSAYANAYASKICAGKIKDPSGVKRKDFKGPKPANKGTFATTKNKKREIDKEADVRTRKKVQKKIEANKSERYSNKPGKDFYGPRKPKLKKLGRVYPGQPSMLDVFKESGSPIMALATPLLRYKARKDAEETNEGIDIRNSEIAAENRKRGYIDETYSKGGFNKVGNHEVMGSPISVDVDDDNLMNSSAQAYYKDLLK
jgi:hypothetical protein